MPRNCVFGPVDADFATRYLAPLRASGECRSFGYQPGDGIDFVIAPSAPWDALANQFPADWHPDFVALALAYFALPAFVAQVPIPVVGLAADWNLLWDSYQHILPNCDLVLTDAPGVEALRASGLTHVEPANLFGGSDTWLPITPADSKRDIDLIFIGNLSPSVTRQRLPLVGQLANLAQRHTVVIDTGIEFAPYRALLQRARVVFNPSARREWNLRVCEAVACGCLVAIDADNSEVTGVLRPGAECLTFTPDNLETVLAEILADEPRRQALAHAAQEKLGDLTFARFWREAVLRIEPRLAELGQRGPSLGPAPEPVRQARVAAHWNATRRDPDLLGEVVTPFDFQRASPADLNNLALLYACSGDSTVAGLPGGMEHAARLLEQGLKRWPGHPLLAYNLLRLLLQAGNFPPAHALTLAQQVLRFLTDAPLREAHLWDVTAWPLRFDEVLVEWRRAGWEHPTDILARRKARREVLRWFVQTVLGELDERGSQVALFEALRSRDDLARGRALLGLTLARQGHPEAAVEHLQEALRLNPFEHRVAAALAQVLTGLNRQEELAALQTQRRLLRQAAPRLLPAESILAPRPTPTPVQPARNGVVPGRNGTAHQGNGKQTPRPTGLELASIIIPCLNQLDFTRPCLDSVLRYTRQPFELILVDNGSSDGTSAFLQEFKKSPGPGRIEVITNAQNQGFGKGCNQGIAATRGRYLVFLNNDTLVTPDWLQRLINLSLHDYPKIGMTGPVSNRVIPEQQIPVPYRDVSGLLAFAQQNQQRSAGQCGDRERLSGFCLLARREVLDQIGTFDERFQRGYFEDDDLCLRARRAGYRLAVALDVFVHHHGGQTIKNLDVDPEQLLRENLERFRAKWGDLLPARYRTTRFVPLGTPLDQDQQSVEHVEQDSHNALFAQLPAEAQAQRDAVFQGSIDISPAAERPDYLLDPDTGSPTGASAARRSLCIITRDEQANIRDCIAPVLDLFDEVIVNDTGSTDRTIELARALGPKVKVIENRWQDSFSVGRNQSLAAATGDWVLWLDADDRVSLLTIHQLRRLFARLRREVIGGVAMTCRCDSADGNFTDVSHVRLFRRHPQVLWEHRVHEQIVPALRRLDGIIDFRHDIVIRHVGYVDPALRGRKLDRDLRLLLLELTEMPGHPFTLFNIGNVYLERGNFIEAIPLFKTSLENSHPGDSIVRKLHANLARCQWELGQRQTALGHCTAGRKFYPRDEELLFLTALYQAEMGNLEGARRDYLELIEGEPEENHFGSVATGLRDFKAMINLAGVELRLGNGSAAEAWLRRALNSQPGFVPGWVLLAEVLAARGDRHGVTEVARTLREQGRVTEAETVRSRLLGNG